VRFGQGVEGLIHVSNLSRERVEHPGDVLKKGQSVSAEVLTVRQGGKRVGLGLKQLQENPWKRLVRTHHVDQIVLGRVTRGAEFGVFLSIARGVEGLLHESESGLGPERRLREVLRPGQSAAVRIVAFDVDAERMSLSRLHRNGALVRPEDVLEPGQLDELQRASGSPIATNLGQALQRALEAGDPGSG
jgi:small subunit ribosomal protein S1